MQRLKCILLSTLIVVSTIIPVYSADFGKQYVELGPVGDTGRELATKAINNVEKDVIQKLKENNYIFILTANDVQSIFTGGERTGEWLGATDDELFWIVVQSESYLTPDSVYKTTLHELGHGLNNIYGKFSNSSAWKYCYDHEMEVVAPAMSRDNLYNPSEYFSECFELYHTNREVLQVFAPYSYVLMDSAIKNVSLLPSTASAASINGNTTTQVSTKEQLFWPSTRYTAEKITEINKTGSSLRKSLEVSDIDDYRDASGEVKKENLPKTRYSYHYRSIFAH